MSQSYGLPDGVTAIKRCNKPEYTPFDGKVTRISQDSGRGGYRVWVDTTSSDPRFQQLVFHDLSHIEVTDGQELTAGDVIGMHQWNEYYSDPTQLPVAPDLPPTDSYQLP